MGIDKVRYIPLTQGKFAIVDAEDYERLNQWNWHICDKGSRVYACRSCRKNGHNNKIWMHRVVLNAPNGTEVDHTNGNGLDNRRANVRLCNHSENSYNRRRCKNKTSKYKGVSWFQSGNKWRVTIRVNKKQISLGYFKSEVEAALTYDRAAIKYFGSFAKLNFNKLEA